MIVGLDRLPGIRLVARLTGQIRRMGVAVAGDACSGPEVQLLRSAFPRHFSSHRGDWPVERLMAIRACGRKMLARQFKLCLRMPEQRETGLVEPLRRMAEITLIRIGGA